MKCHRSISIYSANIHITMSQSRDGSIQAHTDDHSILIPSMKHGLLFQKASQYVIVRGLDFTLKWDGEDSIFVEVHSVLACIVMIKDKLGNNYENAGEDTVRTFLPSVAKDYDNLFDLVGRKCWFRSYFANFYS